MLEPLNQTTPTLHKPLHSKVSNYLNNQRRTGQYCDLILELENTEEALSVHFCVVAAQSGFISNMSVLQKPNQLQFSIHNPLKITVKDFGCVHCFRTIVDFFYEDIVSVSTEHEQHFMNLAKILAVTELLNLFDIQPESEVECIAEEVSDVAILPTGNQAKTDDIFESQPNYFKLKNPRATKASSKINYCIGCDFKCYPVQKMIAHMSSCEPSHLTCSLCEVGFLGWREYDAHLRKHSSDIRKPFFCLECDTRFLTRGALIIHQPKHTTETPHICNHCGKGFKWKQGLKNHLVVHTTEKQMLCDVCGYSTTHMKALKSHKLQHTGEYFKCTVPGCGHRANRKENMKLHIETHKQERDFICEICGCKFSQSKNLKRHALKHSENGVKRYKCELCGFCSHRSDKIKEHMQRVHTEKGILLELPEVVEGSFENKAGDDFALPILDVIDIVDKNKDANSVSEEVGGNTRFSEGKTKLTSQQIGETVKEKRLRTLLPKSAVK